MKYCRSCGKQIDDDAKFCPDCGATQESNQNYNTVNSEEQILKGFGLGFVLGFLLGLIGFVLGICLGDEKCKKGSIYGIITNVAVVIVFFIIYEVYQSYIISSIVGVIR